MRTREKSLLRLGVQLTGRELICLAHGDSMFDVPTYFSLRYFLH